MQFWMLTKLHLSIVVATTLKCIKSFFPQTTGAHCTVDKNAPPDAQEKNFIIRGTPEAVERAKAMILEKLGMQDGGYGGGGGGRPGGSYGGAAAAAGWGGGNLNMFYFNCSS